MSFVEKLPTNPTGVEEIRIHTLEGLTLAGKVWGRPEGSLRVLAVHGWLDNSATFDLLIPLLLKKNAQLRIVAIDLSGHGLSTHRAALSPHSHPQYLGEVRDVLSALGWERCTLMGHSLGGIICMFYAALFPASIDRLVVLDALGPDSASPQAALSILRFWVVERDNVFNRKPRSYESRDALIKKYHEANPDLSIRAIEILTSRGAWEQKDGWQFRHSMSLKSPSSYRLTEEAVQTIMRSVECPVLLVRAFQSQPARWQFSFDPAQRIGSLRSVDVKELPGSHHVHLDDPESVAPHVSRFLGSPPRISSAL
jgi:pimeloyl-ACP methyl ester carboxylesterase